MSDEIEDVVDELVDEIVDGLVDEIENEAKRLGVSELELARRIKVEIAAKMKLED